MFYYKTVDKSTLVTNPPHFRLYIHNSYNIFMTNKNTLITVVLIAVLAVLGYFFFFNNSSEQIVSENGTPTNSEQKINIDQVCNDALIYMTFTDSVAAELFVKECKEGKHPQVIEDYKARLNLGAGAEI